MFQKLDVHNAAYNNPLISGLESVNEVRKRVGCILDEILVFFYWRLYDLLCHMLSLWFLTVFNEII